MKKVLKIFLMSLLLVLVVLAIVAESPVLSNIPDAIHLAFYLRAISLFGLIIAVFAAWGYKRKIEASQKYRRADEILAEAEATAKRKERTNMLLEEKLKADYSQKEKDLQDQMVQIKRKYKKKMMALKTQNIQLKEAVARLMGALKKTRQSKNEQEKESKTIRPMG